MIGLDEAKEIIRRSGEFSQVDAEVVFEDGWVHLGDDHFCNEARNLLAGPGEGPVRILVNLSAATGEEDMELKAYDIAMDWERQAPAEPEVLNAEVKLPIKESREKGRSFKSGRCACDF